MVVKKLLKEATEQFQKAIDIQKDWKQLQHMCFWELGIIYMMEEKWQETYDMYDVLQKESNWSKAVYTYLKAINLYMLANGLPDDSEKKKEYLEDVNKLMDQVNGEKKKIAGKSVPMEVSLIFPSWYHHILIYNVFRNLFQEKRESSRPKITISYYQTLRC
jgi:tetratricopeptide (TPR) repeat protein